MIYLLLFLLSTGLTYFYIHHAWRNNWIDTPNARSSHTQLTPRGGGVIFIGLWVLFSVIALFCQIWTLQQSLILIPGTLLVAVTGFCDDRCNIPFYWRILIYFMAAIISVIGLGGFNHLILNQNLTLSLGLAGSVLAVLAIVWSINLFNFMDGLDGIAATEAFFILTLGGGFVACAGGHSVALFCWSLSACILGFLVWNKPAAKVFMGDTGSATLGFVMMVLPLWAEKSYHVPILLWFILYGVFLMDATFTLVRRFLAKEKIYEPHRLHAYQRVHQAGFSHGKVLLFMILTNTFLAFWAMIGFYYPNSLLFCCFIAFATLLVLYLCVEHMKPMYLKI